MAANVLGQGVNHDVRAMLERAAQERRGHGVIDNQRNAVLVCNLGPLLDVHHVAGRVADRLAEQGPGLVVNGVLYRREIIVGGHHLALNALVRQGMGKQVVGPAVQLAGADNIVAHLADGLQGIGDRGHAGGYGQGANTTFQRCHTLFQNRVGGGVHDAGIDVALYLQVKQVGTMLGVVEGVRRGLVNGRGGGLVVGSLLKRRAVRE